MPNQVLSRKMDRVSLINLSSENCYRCKKSLGGTGSIVFITFVTSFFLPKCSRQKFNGFRDTRQSGNLSRQVKLWSMAVVVALLVELSLSTPEIRGLNPDIGKILSTSGTIEKMKVKNKRPGMARL